MKRWFAFFLALVMCLGCLSACGGSGSSSASPENTFTWWLQVGEDTQYYDDYDDNPSVLYMLAREWNGEKLAIDFSAAPAGAEQDNFNQMLATGEYLDVLTLGGIITQTPRDLYDEGIIIDLTELVQQYMPNYWNAIQTVSYLSEVVWTDVNGEQKLLNIQGFFDAPQGNFQGYMYRRDWVAKYGANPSTGAAFTYGYTDPADKESWQDDVLFPSFYGLTYTDGKLQENADTKAFVEQYKVDYPYYDGSHPITISDWEWMFEIFDKAHEDIGLDNYHLSMYYPGYNALGALGSGFGGGAPAVYLDGDTVRYGGTEDSMKAYIQCMQSWYEKGWLDKEFDTRSDMFYTIDTANMYQGNVGMFIGVQSQTGAQMDTGVGNTVGIMVYGCPYPVNDIYGGDAQKYTYPNSYYAFSMLTNINVAFTKSAESKNLPALLTALDWLYTEEGSRVKCLGLTQEQAEEFGSERYLEWLPDGGFKMWEEDGVTKYALSESAVANRDAANAMKMNRFGVGLELLKDVDQGRDRYTQMAVELWDLYPTSAVISDPIKAKLTPDEKKTESKVTNNINTYLAKNVPAFIKGQMDINGKDWEDFCTTQNKYGVQKLIDIYQSKYDAIQ